jgi:hypothetical protein
LKFSTQTIEENRVPGGPFLTGILALNDERHLGLRSLVSLTESGDAGMVRHEKG